MSLYFYCERVQRETDLEFMTSIISQGHLSWSIYRYYSCRLNKGHGIRKDFFHLPLLRSLQYERFLSCQNSSSFVFSTSLTLNYLLPSFRNGMVLLTTFCKSNWKHSICNFIFCQRSIHQWPSCNSAQTALLRFDWFESFKLFSQLWYQSFWFF